MRRFYRCSTISLEFTHPGYSGADWTAKLILKCDLEVCQFDAVADPDSEKFEVTISAIESKNIIIGTHQIHYRYENPAGEVAFVPGCEVVFLPAPTEAGDTRSQWEKDLEAIDEAIRKKISGGAVEEYEIQTTVGQRSLKNMNLEDLRKHRRWVLGKVNVERVKAGKKQIGVNSWGQIKSRIGNQTPIGRRHYR